MEKTLSIRKGAILATLMFIFTFAAPLTSSINNVTDEVALDNSKDIDCHENVTINFHIFGIPSKLSKEITVPRFQAEELYNKITDLQTVIASNSKSEEVRQLQQEISDFTLKYDLLPRDLSQKLVSSESNLKESKILYLLSPSKRSSGSASEFLCNFVSTGSGTSLPIIILPRVIPVLLSPIPRALMIWNTKEGVTSCGGLYSNTGFIAYGEQNGIAIGFWGVGFTFNLPPIQGYGVLGYALYANVNAENIQYFPPNNPPVISIPNPTNLEQNVLLTLSKLSFHIGDEDNDLMSYTVTTEPNIGSGSGNLKRDGDYSISVSNLELSTEYTWTVKVNDGKDTTTSAFSFTTIKKEPVISNPYPSDYSSAQKTLTELRFDIFDAQGDLMDYTVETSPDIGSKSAYGVSDGTIIVPVSGLKDDTWYRWYVNVTDGTHWTREVFSFYTGIFGLVGYWSFDEGSGDIVQDSSDNGNNGYISNCNWVSGYFGTALEFPNLDSTVYGIPDTLDDQIIDYMSIEAWVKWYGSYNNLRAEIFDCRCYFGGFHFYITSYNKLGLTLYIDSQNTPNIISVSDIPLNTWTHVKAVFDDNSNSMSLYINNQLDAKVAITNSYSNSYLSGSIGNNRWAPGDWVPFNGIIDELKIWNGEASKTLDYR